jgi:hypothetical protein
MVQVGIREVVFLEDKYPDKEIFVAAKKIFDLAKIHYRRLQPTHRNLNLKL